MLRAGLILFASAFVVSCKSQKAQDGKKIEAKEFVDEKSKIRYNILPEVIPKGEFQPETQQLNFQISKAELVNSDLFFSVKYGGGCKMHEFKLVYPPTNRNDTVNFYLLHLTTDDRCKAYVLNDLKFDLGGILIQNAAFILVNQKTVTRE